MITQIYEQAKWWVGQGIGVAPLTWRSKLPAADALRLVGSVDDQGDATWRPYQRRLPTERELRWWFTGPRRNLAVIMGWQGLVVLDFDSIAAYLAYMAWARVMGGEAWRVAQASYRVLTWRGVHLYLYTCEPVASGRMGAIEVKSKGYVLGALSVHPSGHLYRALDEAAPILVVDHWADVFPFEIGPADGHGAPRTTEHQLPKLVASVIDDPWEVAAAQRRVDGGLVEAIKERSRVEDFFPEAEKTGADCWIACCPFHNDRHPSFWLNTRLQLCGCYAGCTRKPLDVIGLYARLNDIDDREAIRRLAVYL